MVRLCALSILALASVAAPVSAQAPAYDARPLLESLRPSERARVPREAQVSDPAALPLYDLTLDLADDLARFELEETATLTNGSPEAWTDVVFRIFVNAVTPAGEAPLVELISGSCLDNVSCTVRATRSDAIVVRPAQPLAPGARLRVALRLRGRLRALDPSRTTMMGQGMESLGALGGAGHGHGDYGLLATSEGVASMASFFPVLARRRGGRWEESDASTLGDLGTDALFHVRASIRTADGVRVVATGVESDPRVVGARAETLVHAGFVRDFALVASPRLARHERVQDGVRVRSFYFGAAAGTPAEETRAREASARQVLETAAGALRLFQRRFGTYPYTELDVVEAPLVGGAGGVEFTGMVTVATMFYRPIAAGSQDALLGSLLGASGGGASGAGAGNLEQRRVSMLELVTAHEVAHQWWHGIVGSDSRRHPFVDEGLAQYSALLYIEEAHGADRMRAEESQQVTAGYHMMRLMGRPDGAVDQPVSSFPDAITYGGLVYGKGPGVYGALRRQLGDRAFFRGLGAHARAYRFRDAPARALFDRLARGPRGAAVRALEVRWLEESHGDDDLGQPDPARMLGGGGAPVDDQTAQALGRILGGLGGGGAGDGSGLDLGGLMRALGGADGAGADGSGADPGDAQDMLRALMEAMGGAP